jgi:SAM-dependent methyltransferase
MAYRFGGYEKLEFLAEYYDSVYDIVTTRQNRRDIDFYVDFSAKAGGRTLELGCGTGRVLIPTAISESEITGLDLSPYMLKKCQELLEQQPVEVRQRVQLVQGNMTGFNTGDKYALITIPFRPFQHLITIAEQKACLKCIAEHLLPEGKLIFDLFHCYPPRMLDPRYLTEIEDVQEFNLPDGRKLRRCGRTAAFHRSEQYNETEIIYYVTYPDGKTERLVQSFPFRYFFRYEVEHLLEFCGFRIVEMFGNFDRSPFTDDSPEMIFVAQPK